MCCQYEGLFADLLDQPSPNHLANIMSVLPSTVITIQMYVYTVFQKK